MLLGIFVGISFHMFSGILPGMYSIIFLAFSSANILTHSLGILFGMNLDLFVPGILPGILFQLRIGLGQGVPRDAGI